MERKGLSSSREQNKTEKMTKKSEGWSSDEIERLIDAMKVAYRKLRGAREGGKEESVLKQLWDN